MRVGCAVDPSLASITAKQLYNVVLDTPARVLQRITKKQRTRIFGRKGPRLGA